MPPDKGAKARNFFREVCITFVGSLRAMSLYPQEHPEVDKMVNDLFKRLEDYLKLRSSLTMLLVGGDIVLENTPLPDLSVPMARFIERLHKMKFQRIVFHRGMTKDELIFFLQLVLPLLKKPEGAEMAMARSQDRLPHIAAGSFSIEADEEPVTDDTSGVLQSFRNSMGSLTAELENLYTSARGSLSESHVSSARETVATIDKMLAGGEISLKVLLYRRSKDSDPRLHAVNVCALSIALGQRLRLDESMVLDIGCGALFHDIGLDFPLPSSKEGKESTLEERRLQWEHPIRGAEILLAIPGLPDVVPLAAYEHHLHYDGGGYPEQERPRQINMASLIIGLVNAYDNLRRDLPNQEAFSLTAAMQEMKRGMGSTFHPLLLKQFRAMVKDQARIEL